MTSVPAAVPPAGTEEWAGLNAIPDPPACAAGSRDLFSKDKQHQHLSFSGCHTCPLALAQTLGHINIMFVVSESEAAAIRSAYETGGELSAVVELRRLFPGIADNENARQCARTIASWTPLPPLPPEKARRGWQP